MNKVLLTSAIAVANLVTVPAFSKSGFDGFYVGASAGYSSLDAQKKTDYIQSTIGSPTYNINSDTKSNNASGAIRFGYAHQYNAMYMAYELNSLFDHHSTKTNYSDPGDLNMTETLERNWAFGLNFHPGLYLNDKTVIYGKIGLSISKFKYKAQGRAEYGGGADIVDFSQGHNKSLWGFTVGTGIRTELSESCSFIAEIFHTTYQKHKTPTLVENWNDGGPREEKIISRMKPRSTHFTIGLNVKI